MITVHDLATLRSRVRAWRTDGRVAFVPTMGNLHRGHLALVERARELADRVVVSVFVNPLQFGQGEDFDSYPRTLDDDAALLAGAGTDLLFVPAVEVIYPGDQAHQTRVEVPALSTMLCGATRPGHFVGVATVVAKLLNMVQPDMALFGRKDFQQLMVIRRMVEDLAMPVEIIGVDTVREPDGLALSSRNGYLTAAERAIAPGLYAVIQEVAEALRRGDNAYCRLQDEAAQRLVDRGMRPDYVAIRRAQDLGEPEEDEPRLVVLAAAFLGRARLIDNLEVTR